MKTIIGKKNYYLFLRVSLNIRSAPVFFFTCIINIYYITKQNHEKQNKSLGIRMKIAREMNNIQQKEEKANRRIL